MRLPGRREAVARRCPVIAPGGGGLARARGPGVQFIVVVVSTGVDLPPLALVTHAAASARRVPVQCLRVVVECVWVDRECSYSVRGLVEE